MKISHSTLSGNNPTKGRKAQIQFVVMKIYEKIMQDKEKQEVNKHIIEFER